MAREFEQLDAQGYPLPQASPLTGLQTAGLGSEIIKGLIPKAVKDFVPGYESLKAIVEALQERGGPQLVGKAAVGAGAVGGGAAAIPAISPLVDAISGGAKPDELQYVDEATARKASGLRYVDEATARAAAPRTGGAQVPPVTAVSDPNQRVVSAFKAFPPRPPASVAQPPDTWTAILNHLLTTPAR